MIGNKLVLKIGLLAALAAGLSPTAAAPKKAEPGIQLTEAGKQLEANDSQASVEIAVPYTIGLWQPTQPVEISLVNGKNVLHFTLTDGSRGVTIKEFTLTPVK